MFNLFSPPKPQRYEMPAPTEMPAPKSTEMTTEQLIEMYRNLRETENLAYAHLASNLHRLTLDKLKVLTTILNLLGIKSLTTVLTREFENELKAQPTDTQPNRDELIEIAFQRVLTRYLGEDNGTSDI